jgi:hypothetical protein
MKFIQAVAVLLFISLKINAQENNLIFESDSLQLYHTYISINSEENIYPSVFNNGLLYISSYKSNYYNLFFTDLISETKKIRTNILFNLGPAAVVENHIYFTGNSKRLSNNRNYNLTIYKATFNKFRITKPKELAICNNNFNYAHPAISKDGNKMVIVTNENNTFHLLELVKNSLNEWERGEVLFIAQANFEIVSPTYFDDNTIYFASNYYKGGIAKVTAVQDNGDLKIVDVERETGDFNIYKIKRINGQWQLPLLAHEFNSEFDDLGVIFTSDKTGYLTTYRFNNTDNIYYFKLKN